MKPICQQCKYHSTESNDYPCVECIATKDNDLFTPIKVYIDKQKKTKDK